MKIALIGPGIMNIPPENWGAVESLIWDYYQYLNAMGIETDIYNSQNLQDVANTINKKKYDFIHLHYDDYAAIFSQLLNQPFCTTTHYGYIKEYYPNYGNWQYIFDGVLKSPGIISLSKEISEIFIDAGYNKFLKTLRNGARTKDFIKNNNPEKYGLCLGKIEPRKKQTELAYTVGGVCPIEFVGPVIDNRFRLNNLCTYGGVWSKQQLYNNLSNYKCLILLSDGEAAPLVVPEALSAGLSIIVSKTASSNLDTNLPFIHVISNNNIDNLKDIINYAINNNYRYRSEIIKYAEEVFDWSVICKEYLSIIESFINENSIHNNSNQ